MVKIAWPRNCKYLVPRLTQASQAVVKIYARASVSGAKRKDQLPVSSRRNYDVLMSGLSASWALA
jgi:hypothetical protein